MNTRLRTLAIVCTAVALASFVRIAAADDAKKTTTTTTTTTTSTPAMTPEAKQQAMMAEMAKLGMPGPVHAALKSQVGTWNATVTSWDTGPQPVTTTGTETRQMILGDRYLQSHYTGTFMGQPYEGWGLTGYDNKTKQLTNVWADNMSTAWMTLQGTMSPDNKLMTCTGSVAGPDGPMAVHTETKIDSDTQNTYTMFGKMNGKDTKLMEIVYTRNATSATAQAK
jgi:hypothetical protein